MLGQTRRTKFFRIKFLIFPIYAHMMNKLLFIFIFGHFSFFSYGQEHRNPPPEKKGIPFHERKNPFPVKETFPTHDVHASMVFWAFGLLQLSYEYMPVNWFGMGATLAYSYKEDHGIRALALPYFRYYIGNNPFFESFVELNTGLVVSNKAIFEGVSYRKELTGYEQRSAFGMGVAAGFKVTPYRHLLLEFKLGVGRDLNTGDDPSFYARPFICVGYRFVKKHHWNYKYGDDFEVYD